MATANAVGNNECQYGPKCYRKNPHHLMSRKHEYLESILPRYQQQGLKITPDIITEFQIQDPSLIEEQLSILHTCKLSEPVDSPYNPSVTVSTNASHSRNAIKSTNVTTSASSFVSLNQTKSGPQKLPSFKFPQTNHHSTPQASNNATPKPSNSADDNNKYLNALNGFSTLCSDSSTKCSICLSNESPYDDICSDTDMVQLQLCQHLFHAACLVEMMKNSSPPTSPFINCPKCKQSYGIRTGTQPTSGKMQSRVVPSSLSGYPDCGTIEIVYTFKAGLQGPEHPNPGQVYTVVGFPRRGYLPDNDEGKLVLKLMELAFKRRLVFTVGRSVTTGRDDVVTWNDIHHKTKPDGPHGYPDEDYLENVLNELKSMGISEEDLDK